MTNDIVVEYGNICCSSTDIDKTNTRFLFFIVQYGEAGRQWLQDKILYFKPTSANAFIDVVDRICLRSDDMKVGFKTYTRHTNRFLDAILVVNHIILRHHVNDLTPWRNHHAVHVLRKTLNILDCN